MCHIKIDAVDELLEAFRIQANRETDWFHLTAESARYIFEDALSRSLASNWACPCKCPTLDILTDMARKMLDE